MIENHESDWPNEWLQRDVPNDPLEGLVAEHPRLIATPDRITRLKTLLEEGDTFLQKFIGRLRVKAEDMYEQETIPFEIKNPDFPVLLLTSRKVLERVGLWGLFWILEGDKKWSDRVIRELNAVCGYPTWNPEHFLDVAEMCTAVAIGLDWVGETLSTSQTQRYVQAIRDLGLKPGLIEDQPWKTAETNWNQVCHGGLAIGAITIAEHEPEIARQVLKQSREGIWRGLKNYAPDGVYPEGPGYWFYGSFYSVLLDTVLHSALQADWGIKDVPGFRESFRAQMALFGPTSKPVNFADGNGDATHQPLHFWAADRYADPALGAFAQESSERIWDEDLMVRPECDRSLPLLIPFLYDPSPQREHDSTLLDFVGRGPSQVGSLRSGMGADALFISLKGGTPCVHHGHMDIGSIIVDADGRRWCEELGKEDLIYKSREGWGQEQDALRWSFLRTHNLGHATLTFGGQRHRVKNSNPLFGPASSVATDEFEAINTCMGLDASASVDGIADQWLRGVALIRQRQALVICDTWHGLDEHTDLCWRWITSAEAVITKHGREIVLSQEGKSMTLQLLNSAIEGEQDETQSLKVQWSIERLTPMRADEQQNEDHRAVSLRISPPAMQGSLCVLAVPGTAEATDVEPEIPALTDWPCWH